MHGTQDVLFRRLAHGILLIVRQDNHVLAFVAEVLDQVARHVLHIVDASAKLPSLAEVIDANQQRFPTSGTVTILKRISLGSSMAEALWSDRRRGRGLVGVRCYMGHVTVSRRSSRNQISLPWRRTYGVCRSGSVAAVVRSRRIVVEGGPVISY
jgi:hypothetical protein